MSTETTSGTATSDAPVRLTPPASFEDDRDVLDVAALILRKWRVLIILPILGALIAFVWSVALPRTFTTRLSFTPVSPSPPTGGLASLAGQLGFDLGTDRSSSPEFYATLLRTREILEPLVLRQYNVRVGNRPVRASFITLLDISGRDTGRTIAEGISAMSEEVLRIGVDRRTSIVSVSVETPWPDLSLQIAEAIVASVDSFNIRNRHLQRGAERQFFEERLDTARTELRVAQDRLEEFYAQNRSFEQDPRLQFEHDRLRTEANLRAEVFASLTQAYEQARVAAVRSTPSVAPVEEPKLALKPDPRGVIGKTLLGVAAGAILAIVWLAWFDITSRARRQQPWKYAQVQELWRSATDETRSLFRRSATRT